LCKYEALEYTELVELISCQSQFFEYFKELADLIVRMR